MNVSTVFTRQGFPDYEYGRNNYRRPEICHNPVLLSGPGGKTLTRSCGSWKCPVCGKRKKAKLEKAIKVAVQGRKVRHLVLTLKEDENMMQKWNNFKTQMQKRGKLLEYVWVKEFQQRGVRHLHILIFEFIRHELINRYWEGISSIGFVRGSKNYISKYLGDVNAQLLFNPGEKRYSTSQDLFVPQECPIPNPGFRFVKIPDEEYRKLAGPFFEDYYKRREIFFDIVKSITL